MLKNLLTNRRHSVLGFLVVVVALSAVCVPSYLLLADVVVARWSSIGNDDGQEHRDRQFSSYSLSDSPNSRVGLCLLSIPSTNALPLRVDDGCKSELALAVLEHAPPLRAGGQLATYDSYAWLVVVSARPRCPRGCGNCPAEDVSAAVGGPKAFFASIEVDVREDASRRAPHPSIKCCAERRQAS